MKAIKTDTRFIFERNLKERGFISVLLFKVRIVVLWVKANCCYSYKESPPSPILIKFCMVIVDGLKNIPIRDTRSQRFGIAKKFGSKVA